MELKRIVNTAPSGAQKCRHSPGARTIFWDSYGGLDHRAYNATFLLVMLRIVAVSAALASATAMKAKVAANVATLSAPCFIL